jgi:hypothetical protein
MESHHHQAVNIEQNPSLHVRKPYRCNRAIFRYSVIFSKFKMMKSKNRHTDYYQVAFFISVTATYHSVVYKI